MYASGAGSDDNWFQLQYYNSSTIRLSGYNTAWLETSAKYRDRSSWYHVVLVANSTEATASNRLKLYVNGEQVSSFSTDNRSSIVLNQTWGINKNSVAHYIGSEGGGGGYLNGYLSESYFIDGQALTPTDFGEFDADSGIWKPIAYSGTYGTNGFFLEFQDSGALGTDSSGKGNTFTVNNLTSIDQTTDTPTNNFATLNALDNYYAQATFSNGNLTMVTPVTEYGYVRSSIGVSSGKWYAECKITTASATDHSNGVAFAPATSISQSVGINDKSYGYFGSGLVKFNNSSVGGTYASLSAGDIIGIALDLDNNKLYFSKNGVFQNSGDPTSGATGTGAVSITAPSSTTDGFYYFASSDNANLAGGTYQFDWDFGNAPYTIASGNADANGYGNFEYAVPAGYYALNTKNLAEFG
jgi:hypothetical protein